MSTTLCTITDHENDNDLVPCSDDDDGDVTLGTLLHDSDSEEESFRIPIVKK